MLTLGKAEFSIDELVDELILLEKIGKAAYPSERSKTYTTEEAQQLLKQWVK